MPLSPEQLDRINTAYSVFNAFVETMKKGIGYGTNRIKRLMDAGFHIERMMVNAQLVEHAVKGVLHDCRLKREVYDILGLPDPFANIGKSEKKQKHFEEKFARFSKEPLGNLTGLLRQTTGEDELAKKLDVFNEQRREFIHQAFNGTRSLEEIDKEADDYLTNKDDLFDIVINGLARVHASLQKEITDLVEKVHSEGVEPTKPQE